MKNLGIVLGIFLVLAPQYAAAGIEIGEKLSMFGDVRFRIEESETNNVDSDRMRYRARLGAKYTVNENWSMRIRLANNGGSGGAQDTMGNGGAQRDIGVDQAFIIYARDGLNTKFGKVSTDFWAASELVYDGDAQDEGLQVNYNVGPFGFHLGYFIQNEAGSETGNNDDEHYLDAQVTYGQALGDMKLKLAVGIVDFDDDEMDTLPTGALDGDNNDYTTDEAVVVSAQLKGANWRVAADYISGDAEGSDEDTAIVYQGRYKINDSFGVRIYYYDVEANSLPMDGGLTQDNTPGTTSNTEGFRYQIDYNIASNVAADLRYYDMEENSGTAYESERLQVNLNVKF